MRELMQGFVVSLFEMWGFSKEVMVSFSKRAITKKYEDGVLQVIGLTGSKPPSSLHNCPGSSFNSRLLQVNQTRVR